MKNTWLALFCMVCITRAEAQQKVVIIGSSTAEGWFASSGHSFVERLQAHYPMHTFINLAYRGTNTYQAREESFPGKPATDPLRNVLAALSLDPDIILVAYPTNDVTAGFTNEETINNLKNIDSSILARGKLAFFIGTQPRDFPVAGKRAQLATQNSMIMSALGIQAINVYPELVGADGYIASSVAYGDGIHLNDEGHRRVFQKVVDKNMFQSNYLLPVRLTRFVTELQGSAVSLSWETASEQNTDRFSIERSSNGGRFRSIGTVKAKGNTNKPAAYNFRDNAPAEGTNDYRLAMVDRDGKTKHSKTVRIKIGSAAKTRAYPIPASSMLNVSTTQPPNTEIRFMVVDALGNPVLSESHRSNSGKHTCHLNVSSLRPGSYQLLVRSANGTERIPFVKH